MRSATAVVSAALVVKPLVHESRSRIVGGVRQEGAALTRSAQRENNR
jgi:hypothetical protein